MKYNFLYVDAHIFFSRNSYAHTHLDSLGWFTTKHENAINFDNILRSLPQAYGPCCLLYVIFDKSILNTYYIYNGWKHQEVRPFRVLGYITFFPYFVSVLKIIFNYIFYIWKKKKQWPLELWTTTNFI